MPGEIIDQPNPQLMPSHVPAVVDELAVKLAKTTLRETDYVALRTFRRAANYIAAGTSAPGYVILCVTTDVLTVQP